MALGLPVVAFDIPVMREYLGEHGVYAPLGDADAFARQIQVLLEDPARARAIGAAVRARAVKLFSWERAGREIEQVYERARADCQ
jgi:glycosyltransferase involved in cell wall biosynthesis